MSHNIELPSQSPFSSSQLYQRRSSSYPRPSHHQFGYLPQHDEYAQQDPPIPPINPQSSSLEGKLKACVEGMFKMDLIKATKIAFYLIMFFYIIDLAPLYYFHAELLTYASHTPHMLGALQFMSANLKADPIMDIKIIDGKSPCPAGFETLKLSTWPGTVAGCLCENGDLFDSPCEKSQSGKCKTIPKVHSVDIYEIDGSRWCAKRAVPEKEYVKKTECPSGYKECFIGGCFVGDCPITNLEIDSNGTLVFTKAQGELPVVDIKATPNDLPCFNQDFSPNSPDNNSYYKLLITNWGGCDKYGIDKTFSKRLDSKLIFNSYTQNSYRYSVMNLPDYDKYAKNTVSVISSRTRIMTTKNDYCLNLDENFLRDSVKKFERSFPIHEIIIQLWVAHVGIVLMTILCRFCYCCCCCGSGEFFLGLSRSGIAAFNLLSLYYLPALIHLFMRTDDYKQIKVLRGYFEEFNTLKCFGEGQGSQVISDYLELLRMGEYQYLMYFGLAISYGIPILIFCWFLVVKKVSSPQTQNSNLAYLPSDLPRDFASV